MKNISFIGLFFVLILLVHSQANSQLKSSATQTVTFAVNRSTKPNLKVIANIQTINTSLKSSETMALENQLKQESAKITVSAVNSFCLDDKAKRVGVSNESPTVASAHAASMNLHSESHIDLISVLESKKSIASDITPLVFTITE